MTQRNLSLWILFAVCITRGQNVENADKLTTWLYYQTVPNLTWTTFPSQTHFAFEWEATPLMYSLGINRYVSPWYVFFVEPPARFSGSLEFTVSGLVYTTKPGSSYFGTSAQLVAHIPLIERGEHLALNAGIAKYFITDTSPTFYTGGFSTLFGFLHFNLKYSPDPRIWMTSVEFRFF